MSKRPEFKEGTFPYKIEMSEGAKEILLGLAAVVRVLLRKTAWLLSCRQKHPMKMRSSLLITKGYVAIWKPV